MPQIKASTIDPTRYFTLSGLDYDKGNWALTHSQLEYNSDGTISNSEDSYVGIIYKLCPDVHLVTETPVAGYTDSSNNPYTSLDTLLTDLGTLLGL